MENWHKGPWVVVPERKLQDRPRLQRGQILSHENGMVIVTCPKCGAMQFVTGRIDGPADSPTLIGYAVCGSGQCNRCGEKTDDGFSPTTFTIVNGEAVRYSQPSPQRKVSLPPIRGLKKAPKV